MSSMKGEDHEFRVEGEESPVKPAVEALEESKALSSVLSSMSSYPVFASRWLTPFKSSLDDQGEDSWVSREDSKGALGSTSERGVGASEDGLASDLGWFLGAPPGALDSDVTSTLPEPGELLGERERFEIIRVLGRGGMGAVFLARDRVLGRRCVIKLILPANAKAMRRRRNAFEKEARITASLEHPNIITLHDFGLWDDQVPFLVLEYLRGRSLDQVLLGRAQRGEALPQARSLEIVCQMLRGLIHAHEQGIFHRDLKPANLFVLDDGRVKLLDLGVALLDPNHRMPLLAEALDDGGGRERRRVLGSPRYMAPEQYRGEEQDARTDLWAVGMILFELLANRHPYGELRELERLEEAIVGDARVPALRRWCPGLSESILSIVERALSKVPGERFQTARELLEALSEVSEVVAPGGSSRGYFSHADDVLNALKMPAERQLARELLCQLVTEDRGRRRRSIGWLLDRASERARAAQVLSHLIREQLLSTAHNEGESWVEIAHPALITHWKRLREWIDEDRARLRLHEQLNATATHWEEHGEPAWMLWRGEVLSKTISTLGESFAGTETLGPIVGILSGVIDRDTLTALNTFYTRSQSRGALRLGALEHRFLSTSTIVHMVTPTLISMLDIDASGESSEGSSFQGLVKEALARVALFWKVPDALGALLRLMELYKTPQQIPPYLLAPLREAPGQVVPLLLERLEGGSRQEQTRAVQCIGVLGKAAKAALPSLVELIDGEDASLRVLSIKALVSLGEVASPALRSLLGRDTWRARQAGMEIIAAAPSCFPGSLGAIVQALVDEHPSLRRAAARALSKVAPDAPETVVALSVLLGDSQMEVRQSAANILGRLGSLASQEALLSALYDVEPERRLAAVHGISITRQVSDRALPGLLRVALCDVRSIAAACFSLQVRNVTDVSLMPVLVGLFHSIEMVFLPGELLYGMFLRRMLHSFEELLPELAKLLDEAEAPVRDAAFMLMVRLGLSLPANEAALRELLLRDQARSRRWLVSLGTSADVEVSREVRALFGEWS